MRVCARGAARASQPQIAFRHTHTYNVRASRSSLRGRSMMFEEQRDPLKMWAILCILLYAYCYKNHSPTAKFPLGQCTHAHSYWNIVIVIWQGKKIMIPNQRQASAMAESQLRIFACCFFRQYWRIFLWYIYCVSFSILK